MSKLLFNAAVFTEKMRYKEVRQAISLLEKGNAASKNELEELRNKLFTDLIQFIYNNNIFYKNVFNAHGLKPADFKTLSDITKLPLLTKTAIKENRKDLSTPSIPQKDVLARTSGGTTGEPIFIEVVWVATTPQL
jgi:phenylacetate-CoA ligase